MTPPTDNQSRTAIDIILEDHREVEQLFEEAKSTTDPHEFRQTVAAVIGELVRHSVAEEQYLYPALRQHLDDGDEIADKESKSTPKPSGS